MTRSIGLLAVLLAAGLAILTAPATSAAVLPTLWTVTATPMVLTEGQVTDVTLTVTGGDTRIRCLVVSVPAGFTVLGEGVDSVPAGQTWTAGQTGSGPTSVTFALGSGGGGLQLLQVGTFDIQVMPVDAPLGAWTTTGHTGKSPGSPDAGPPLLPLQPFVIIPGPTPTPTATPTPTPTPTDTPTPTPTLGPTPTPGATPSPTARPSPTAARPGSPTPDPTRSPGSGASPSATPTDSPTASPTGSPSPSDSDTTGSGAGPVGGTGGGPSAAGSAGRGVVTVAAAPVGGAVTIGNLGVASVVGLFAWLVPVTLLGLPGLLLLIIGAQLGTAGLFVPLTRRVLADRETRSGA